MQDKQSLATSAVARLTERETQVLQRIIGGLSNKLIGRDLGISHRTVEIHRANLMRKLDGSCTADVVRIGIYAGLAPK